MSFKPRTGLTIAALAAGCLISLSATGYAQGTAQQRSACMGDAFRFCVADIPDVGRIEACLDRNRASLTPACAAEFRPAGRTLLRPEHFRE